MNGRASNRQLVRLCDTEPESLSLAIDSEANAEVRRLTGTAIDFFNRKIKTAKLNADTRGQAKLEEEAIRCSMAILKGYPESCRCEKLRGKMDYGPGFGGSFGGGTGVKEILCQACIKMRTAMRLVNQLQKLSLERFRMAHEVIQLTIKVFASGSQRLKPLLTIKPVTVPERNAEFDAAVVFQQLKKIRQEEADAVNGTSSS